MNLFLVERFLNDLSLEFMSDSTEEPTDAAKPKESELSLLQEQQK